jgi:serine/threonine-protein kinase
LDKVDSLKGFRIGEWRVEPTLNQIFRDAEPDHGVRLEPKAMQVLAYLAERAGTVVDKDSVIRDVWEGAFVTNEVLTNAIWELRRALGDDARSSVYIQTIPKRGYRLVAPVSDLEAAGAGAEVSPPKRSKWWIAALAAAVGAALWLLQPRPEPQPTTRFELGVTEPLAGFYLPALVVSPDGGEIVYAGTSGLFVRRMDRLESTLVPGTQGGHGPFFSPDGDSIGFFSESRLKRVELHGESPPKELARVGAPRGASWGTDGFIYFSPVSNSGLMRVRADGGEVEAVTELDESQGEWTHRWPEVLPGSSAVLLTVARSELSSFDEADLVAVDLRTRKRRVVVQGASFGRYNGGRLLYSRGGAILEVPFEPDALETRGSPRSLLEDAAIYSINGAAQFALSRRLVVYVPESKELAPSRLQWSNRRGERELLLESAKVLYDPALSPDGSKVAVSVVTEGNSDLWIYDRDRETFFRLTSTAGEEEHPIFAPNGREVAYDYSMAGPFRLYSRLVDGAGEPRNLGGQGGSESPEAFPADGNLLVFTEEGFEGDFDLSILDLSDSTRRPLLATPFDERSARLSPDGRWIAYSSNESGKFEIYATAFPEIGARLQVSVAGGEHPRWTRGGKEIVFLSSEGVMAVEVATEGSLSASKPRLLFPYRPLPVRLERTYRTPYDVSADGERFLLLEREDAASDRIHGILNWLEER